MRTTLDLPDALLRQLKARAALEGTTLKTLLRNVVEQGLKTPPGREPVSPTQPPEPDASEQRGAVRSAR